MSGNQWTKVSSKNAKHKKNPRPHKPTKNSENKENAEAPQPDIFKKSDQNEITRIREENIMKKIQETQLTSMEIILARKQICDHYQITDDTLESSWDLNPEIQNVIFDLRRKKCNLPPIFSEILREAVILNSTASSPIATPVEPLDGIDPSFNKPIALIREYQDLITKEWKKEMICIIRTFKNFWWIIEYLHTKTEESLFTSAFQQVEAEKIFTSLIDSGRKNHHSDTVEIDQKMRKSVMDIIARFNGLHPIWTFALVPENMTMNNNIDYRFEKKDININTKETRANADMGIKVINAEFNRGYLTYMLMDFVCANMPEEISALTFSKTIAANRTTYFRGYRARLWLDKSDTNTVAKCKDYLDNDYLPSISKRDGLEYYKCIVNMSFPKS
jgi:hypothetical protein